MDFGTVTAEMLLKEYSIQLLGSGHNSDSTSVRLRFDRPTTI